jgi:3-oxoacyl-ACP reductase-like protein
MKSLSKLIKALVGGKSTLRNESLGDLQQEFNAAPEKGEELSLGRHWDLLIPVALVNILIAWCLG